MSSRSMPRPLGWFRTRPNQAVAGWLAGPVALVLLTAASSLTATVAPRSAVVELKPGVAAPELADLEVTLDGRAAEVLAAGPVSASGGWNVLVYFDTPLLSPAGLAKAVETLSASAEELLALGSVTLVAADPQPRELAVSATLPHEIREALELFADRSTLAGELLWRRLRFLDTVRSTGATEEHARQELERERALIERQQLALESCLQRHGSDRPSLLVLVQDGFDLDFKRFYLSRTPRLEELDSDLAATRSELERRVAAGGWTVLGAALGDQGSEFVRPREPLERMAAATGGMLAREPRDLRGALAEMGARYRVSFRPAGDQAGLQRLEIAYRDRPRRAARWTAPRAENPPADLPVAVEPSAEAVLRLLVEGSGPHAGPTRVSAVTGGSSVAYVAFFLDDFLVDVVHRPPYRSRLELPVEPTRHTVRAAAFTAAGVQLGEDARELNRPDAPFRVEIVEVAGDPRNGRVELLAHASAPFGRQLTRLDFYWNDELRESVETPASPIDIAMPIETGPPAAGAHYRVVAHLDDGSSMEAARLASGAAAADRVDVNLVELFALVSARAGTLEDELERDDFALFHGGQSQPIQGFARAADVPLTLGVAVDTSDSMADWQSDLRDGAAVFFERTLREGDRALLTDFHTQPRLTQAPTASQDLLVGRMGGLEFGGYTALYDAILFSLAQFEDETGRKALVVLSDGDDYGSRFRPERCIAEARRLGVPIYMVILETKPLDSLSRMINQRLARQTGGQLHYFSSGDGLLEVYEAIEADLRSQYLLTWAVDRPLTVADLRDIRVEVRDRGLSVRTVLGRSVRAR